MYEAMYNIQSRSQQARDSGILLSILNLSATFMQTCNDFSLKWSTGGTALTLNHQFVNISISPKQDPCHLERIHLLSLLARM